MFQAPLPDPVPDVTDNVALLPMLAGVPNAEARKRRARFAGSAGRATAPAPCPGPLGRRAAARGDRARAGEPPAGGAWPTNPRRRSTANALAVIRILNDMAQRFETAVIVVTHDEKIIPTFKRIYHIRDGITHEEGVKGRRPGATDSRGSHAMNPLLQRNRWLRGASVFAVLFGLLTLKEGGTVLFGGNDATQRAGAYALGCSGSTFSPVLPTWRRAWRWAAPGLGGVAGARHRPGHGAGVRGLRDAYP